MTKSHSPSGKRWLGFASVISLVAVILMVFSMGTSKPAEANKLLKVYKSPTCGCCGKWVDNMEQAGFDTEVTNVQDVTPVKRQFGVPAKLRACHTARVGDYYIEGHVPAEDVQRLLAEKPDIAGLAVPGMPLGSPGMEDPSRKPMAYNVYAVDEEGNTSVYARH